MKLGKKEFSCLLHRQYILKCEKPKFMMNELSEKWWIRFTFLNDTIYYTPYKSWTVINLTLHVFKVNISQQNSEIYHNKWYNIWVHQNYFHFLLHTFTQYMQQVFFYAFLNIINSGNGYVSCYRTKHCTFDKKNV